MKKSKQIKYVVALGLIGAATSFLGNNTAIVANTMSTVGNFNSMMANISNTLGISSFTLIGLTGIYSVASAMGVKKSGEKK